MQASKPQKWFCPNGHVVGMVLQDTDHVSYLVEYEHAFQVGEKPAQVRPGEIYEKHGVICTICKARKTFGMDRRKLERLVQRVLAQRKIARALEVGNG